MTNHSARDFRYEPAAEETRGGIRVGSGWVNRVILQKVHLKKSTSRKKTLIPCRCNIKISERERHKSAGLHENAARRWGAGGVMLGQMYTGLLGVKLEPLIHR